MMLKDLFRSIRGTPRAKAIIALIQLAAILVAAGYILKEKRGAALRQVQEQQLLRVGEISGRLKLYAEFLARAMTSVAGFQQVQRFHEDATRHVLALEIDELSKFGVTDIEVLDSQGDVRFSALRSREGRNLAEQTFFPEVVRLAGKKAYLIECYPPQAPKSAEKECVIAVPMDMGAERALMGVVLCRLKVSSLVQELLTPPAGLVGTGPILLLDGDGQVLWIAPDPGAEALPAGPAGLPEGWQAASEKMRQQQSGTLTAWMPRFDPSLKRYAGDPEEILIAHASVELGAQRWTVATWIPRRLMGFHMPGDYARPLLLIFLVIGIILIGPAYSLLYAFRHSQTLENEVTSKTRQLRAARQRLLTILDSLDLLVYVVDPETHEILFVNRHTRELHGDAVGEICWKVFREGQNGPCALCPGIEQREQAGGGQARTWEFQTQSTGRWFEVRDRSIVWEDGRVVRLEIATDITARKASETALRRTTRNLSSLLESLPVTVPFTCEARGQMRFTYLNNAVEQLTGYPVERFLQDPGFWASHLHPNDRQRVVSVLENLEQEGRLSLEYSFRMADGEYKMLQDTRRLITLPDGTVSHVVGTWQDITEGKRLRRHSLALGALSEGDQLGLGEMIGTSARMREVYKRVARVIEMDVKTVLILGETGTGKDLAARVIHDLSPRKEHPFSVINCANLPDHLLESELFGHEKGAFTDARWLKRGLLEQAPMGTIVLNEIGHMKPELQAKLLMVIEERRFRRVGGLKDLDLDVRVIAATNRDLWKATQEGEFREDLYFRLKQITIHMPPLRDRKEDIPLLCHHLIQMANREYNRNVRGMTKEAQDLLLAYSWPGNVRQLKNVIQRAVVFGENEQIRLEDLPSEIVAGGNGGGGNGKRRKVDAEFVLPDDGVSLAALEKALIEQALNKTSGNQVRSAALLGISRHAMRHRMKKYGLL